MADPVFDTKIDALKVPVFNEQAPVVTDAKPAFQGNVEQMSDEAVYASNNVYLNSKMGNVSAPVYQQTKEVHTGVADITDQQAYSMYKGVENTKGEAIDIVGVMNKWAGRGDSEKFHTGEEVMSAPTFKEKFTSGLWKRKRAIAETTETLFEEGGAKTFFEWADFWPSTYRGTKELVGLDDFNIPIIDDIARVSKGLKLGQAERKDAFVEELKEGGYLAEAATVKTLDSVGSTLVFLNEIGKMNMKYGGGLPQKATRVRSVLSKLGHAQKISVFKALTAEDVTMKDRADIWGISTLYMSTPAASSQFSGLAVFGSDFLLNSAISAGKEDGYKDIWSGEERWAEADQFDKIMATTELLGADIVFSAMTKSYKSQSKPFIEHRARIDRAVVEGYRPKPMTPTEEARFEASMEGKGFINVDKAEAQTKANLEETRVMLSDELARLEAERLENIEQTKEAEPAKEGEKTAEKVEEVTKEDPMTNKDIEIEAKKAVAEVLEEVKSLPVEEQSAALQVRMEQLGEVLDAPKGTKVKTLVNNINNIRQKKPIFAMKQKEFYSELQKTSRAASTAGAQNMAKSIKTMNDFVDKSFDYRTADRIKARLADVSTKATTPTSFARQASSIIKTEFAPKKEIDRTVGIKDLSKQVDMSEAQLLRSVMKESEKVAKGARKATVEKIVESQKVAQKIIDDMPADVRKKMISSLRKIASAKTDDTRAKYVEEFKEYSERAVDQYEHREAKAQYNASRSAAEKLIKSGKVSDSIKSQLGSVLDSVRTKTITPELREQLDKAETYDDVEIGGRIIELMEYASLKTPSEMTTGELKQQADLMTGLVHQMKRVSDELKEYGRTKAKSQVVGQSSIVSAQNAPSAPIMGNAGKVIADTFKKVQFNSTMIPRGVAESLDYHKTRGEFAKIQTEVENSYIGVREVERDVESILGVHAPAMDKMGYAKNKDKKPYVAKDLKGNPLNVEVGVADRMLLYLSISDPYMREQSLKAGWKTESGKKTFIVDDRLAERIIGEMSAKEKEIADDFYFVSKEIYTPRVAERSTSLLGYDITDPNFVLPAIRTGTSHLNKEGELNLGVDLSTAKGFNEGFHKIGFDSSGRLKQRKGGNAPLMMYNPVKMMKGLEGLVSRYYGMGEAINSANKFMYEARQGGDGSLKEQYAVMGKESTFKTFEKYIEDLNSPRGAGGESESDKQLRTWTNKGIEYMAQKGLKLNPKVIVSQTASLKTAATAMTLKESIGLEKIFWSNKQASIKEMSEKSPYLWGRYNGKTGIIIGEHSLSKKQQRGFEGMHHMDSRVIGSIWRVYENQLSDKLSGEKLNKAVELEVLRVVMKTQPSFEDVTRPELGRSTNPIAKMAMIFSSQRNKNHYIAYSETATVLQKYRDGTLKMKDVKDASRRLGDLALANGVYALMSTAFQQIGEEVLDATGAREREVGPTAVGDFAEDFIKNYFSAGLSSLGPYASAASSAMSGYDPEKSPFGAVKQDLKSATRLYEDMQEIDEAMENGTLDATFRDNMLKYGRNTANAANLVVMPTTGVNVANLYKWVIEAPTALLGKTEEDAIRRETKRMTAEIEKENKKYE